MLMLNYLNYILIALISRVVCESQKLEEVTVKTLDCRENTCTNLDYPNISEVAFLSAEVTKNLKGYESLILHSSSLANLPRNIFVNLPQLVEFDVLECQLQSIEKECFDGGKNLKRLNLGGNNLKILDRNTFKLATELEELNLSDNQLEDLSTTIFLPLKKLLKINLSNNQLMQISQNTFSQLRSLKSINLNSNQLRELAAELFRDQRKHLSEFSARNNQLERIPSNIFSEVELLTLSFNPQLRSLHLTAKIDELQATNCGLETVKLDGRVLGVQLEDNLSLNELKISQPEDLEQLYLANTNLSRLDFLSKASKLVDLDLTGIENLLDLPKISSARGLERLSFTYDNLTSDHMDMLPQLKDLNYLEISHDKGREIYIKDLDEDFFVEEAELNCGQLADLLEFVELPKDTTILEDRLVGDPRMPLRCGTT
ncbi:LOW QUALITY PROTEIN: leucine-rich repeat-containing protein 15 [Drosophila eugracilis]|uniref:LOW QUALITY PROTEIN: leucine-rich repeat-containing protein 15 n=1 Tax=Drosophila eugracilis TaxID=29029 RepID=UPI001BDB560C|nr:LOW QUALITY PROTEIN: leucine-rich repeat-containing protein 15 [Drosophila eugracilis]